MCGIKRGTKFILAAFLILLVVLCSGCFGGTVEGVRVAEVSRGDVSKTVSAVGVMDAAESIDVIPLVNGTIATMNVREGDYVAAGDVLCTLDEMALQAERAQAEADFLTTVSVGDILQGQWQNSVAMYAGLETASQVFVTMQGQLDDFVLGFYDILPAFMPFVPPDQQEYLKALLAEERANYVAMINSRPGAPSISVAGYPASAYAADVARVEAARYDYERIMEGTASPNITAPVTGYVVYAAPSGIMATDVLSDMLGGLGALTSSMGALTGFAGGDIGSLLGGDTGAELEEGSSVTAGQPLFEIVDLQNMRVEAQIEETDIPRIQVGQTADVYLDAYPDLTFSGEVVQVSVKAETGSAGNTIFPVLVKLETTDIPLRLGYNATVDIKVLSKTNILYIPITALLQENGIGYVYIVDDGKAYLKEIETGDRTEEWVEVVSGLSEGDRIVVEGVGKVSEGQKVE
jgi:multidrug efflux pump subunit AcrA (membrane-fusion protein)